MQLVAEPAAGVGSVFEAEIRPAWSVRYQTLER